MNDIDRIKQAVSIVDVVSDYVSLKKAGKNYKGISPFSQEKTPSFFVSPEENVYYCFSTQKGGDIFTFIQEMEGIDFKGSLRMLAERAGITLTNQYQNRDNQETLFDIMEDATRFYAFLLTKSDRARAYLLERGVTEEVAKKFRIGFAPASWQSLYEWLTQKRKHRAQDILHVGLSKSGQRGFYDTFRERIMFPICDASGRTIAFSGRILPDAKDSAASAKYINSPETPLFNKSHALYGYDKAKQAIRNTKEVIIVEGQLDMVLAHQAGTQNTIALSGTALSDPQFKILKRLAQKIYFALDADGAGERSLFSNGARALREGFDVLVCDLPNGNDPASIIKADPSQWEALLSKPKPIIHFFLDKVVQRYADNRHEQIKEVGARLIPLVAEIPHRMVQEEFMRDIVRKLDLNLSTFEKELRDYEESQSRALPHSEGAKNQERTKESRTRKERVERQIGRLMHIAEYLPQKIFDRKRMEDMLKKITQEDEFERISALKIDTPRAQIEAKLRLKDPEQFEKEMEDLLFELKKEVLLREKEQAAVALRQAEHSGDEERITEALKAYHHAAEQLSSQKYLHAT